MTDPRPARLGLFAPVGLLAAVVALFVLSAAATLYNDSGSAGYLAIAALAGLVLAADVAAALLARRRRAGTGVSLLAAATIAAALASPIFVADVSLPNLVLLAAIPLQIGTVAQLRRVLPATIVAILAAALMVGIDLLDLPNRLTILVEQQGGVLLLLALFGAQFVGLIFLLVWLRLRSGAPHFVRLELATQLPLVFAVISATSILAVTGVLVAQIRDAQVSQVQRNFLTLAEISSERVGNSVDAQLSALLALGRRGTILLDGLDAANLFYPQTPAEREQVLAAREAQWLRSPDASEFVLQYRNNEQSLELSRFRGGDLLHNNVMLLDRYGGLVASQGSRPEHYSYGDAPWFQAAYGESEGGVYVGELHIDPTIGEASVRIATGVINPSTNDVVGVVTSTYDLAAIQREVSGSTAQGSAEVRLIAPDGQLIAGPDPSEVGQLTDAGRLALGQSPSQGTPILHAEVPLTATSLAHTNLLTALGWRVVVSEAQSVALMEVSRSTKVAALVGLLAIALGLIAVVAIARVITRPIVALTDTAAAISAGDLDSKARPEGPVELVTLAVAFNSLTARLSSLINNLQEQVRQRTGQLEARVDQLATLNRITQTVASVHDITTAMQDVTRELVELFRAQYSGVGLLNAEGDGLTVVGEHTRGDGGASGKMAALAGNLALTSLIASRRPLVVARAQDGAVSAALRELLVSTSTECLMVVPLVVRGDVLGAIVVASDEPDRVFSPAEVSLAETVAGQVATAIESAHLFSEMEAAKESAEAANEAKSIFLASVSHELRTPLTSVLGFAKVIRRQLDDRILPHVDASDTRTQRAISQVRENVDVIVTEGERLTTLVNNVLDLAKIEAGRFEWKMRAVSMADVIDRALATTSGLAEAKGLELRRDVPADLPDVLADADGLVQVVINLISNAVKFTERGSVSCRAEMTVEGIVVSIEDTGIGIAPADQQRVFDKFTQVGDTLTDKPHGTGLGLPICREIVERHGGRIWVESVLGKGSTFRFVVPLTPPDSARPDQALEPTATTAETPA